MAIAATILLVWLYFTPAGLLGKADAIGYAVCHQIDARSFHLAGRRLPLCARCSGMYLGAFVGLAFQAMQGKRGGMPPLKVIAPFILGALAFGIDGVNSYLHFFPQAPWLYTPENWLRLITGTAMGLSVAAVVAPAFHQTFWQNWDPHPALGSWRKIGLLFVLAGLVDLAVLSENPLILYPLALLSAATVVLLLSLVYSMVWVMIFRRENRFTRFRDIWAPLMGGLIVALLQIGLIDWGRFWLTGTWQGFHL